MPALGRYGFSIFALCAGSLCKSECCLCNRTVCVQINSYAVSPSQRSTCQRGYGNSSLLAVCRLYVASIIRPPTAQNCGTLRQSPQEDRGRPLVPDIQFRHNSWDGVLDRAGRPSFEAAIATARLRFLARLPRAPVALFALLQVAGNDWWDMLTADLSWLRTALGSAVASLPAPCSVVATLVGRCRCFPCPMETISKEVCDQGR